MAIREPLEYSGSLDSYARIEHTPIIGTEFPDLQVVDILDDDEKLRDLAIFVSQRCVVFLRNQDIDIEQQKKLAQRLGELTGKPSTSTLHKHPVKRNDRYGLNKNENLDDEVTIISSEANRDFYPERFQYPPPLASLGWHTDMSWEKASADYSVLKMNYLPDGAVGGDTLWASGYEAYDRLSSPMKNMADGLKQWHHQDDYNAIFGRDLSQQLQGERGSPFNTSTDWRTLQPVVRTNPVTGWKSLFGAVTPHLVSGIEGVTKHESDILQKYFHQLVAENHDLQVRLKWRQHDMAIWDK
ncbi:unnamed protein product [Clonostachys rhizophaga]|uniref:TauD/TfdA-like domain-containing protein n=1 Tax=Clonostachys rhizophaga TaxID=160324 RepID=A0A9N9VJD4_9HYPO|nr:unnamed protein product [Clonostachys rhizophaga]